MKTISNIVLVIAIVASGSALLLSIYPGVLQEILFFAVLLSCFWLPVVTAFGVTVLIILIRRKVKIADLPVGRLIGAFAILLCSYVLVKFYVPRRVAFLASRRAFEQLIAQAPVHEYGGTVLNRRLGMYWVDDYAADPRGGVYFRVYRGRDGIGPDEMSYGFVHHPNRKGTPFGAAHYAVFRLGSGWYWFRASDDWY